MPTIRATIRAPRTRQAEILRLRSQKLPDNRRHRRSSRSVSSLRFLRINQVGTSRLRQAAGISSHQQADTSSHQRADTSSHQQADTSSHQRAGISSRSRPAIQRA